MKESYEERKKLGICVSCEEKSTNGVYCLEHAIRNKEKATKRFLKLKAAGLCVTCEGPSVSGKIFCKECSAKDTNRQEAMRRRRSAQGLCARCGKNESRPEFDNCEICYQRQKHRRDTAGFFIKRARCIVAMLASKKQPKSPLRPLELAVCLRRIWKKQKGVCVLSGRKLSRVNCQIDHIIPRSKGGLTIESNLRFLYKEVNQALRDMSDLDFIKLCFDIADYNKGIK